MAIWKKAGKDQILLSGIEIILGYIYKKNNSLQLLCIVRKIENFNPKNT